MRRASRVLVCLMLVAPTCVSAKGARVGELEGIVDITVSYGLLARTSERDPDYVAIGNGGRSHTANGDDGNLNYDVGVVTNELRLAGDLTLVWRNFGAFVRGYGFYDFEAMLHERERTDLTSEAKKLVGAGGRLQEYYLSAQFAPLGIPVQLRVGNQVINWGNQSFINYGTDVVNPIDEVSLLRPTSTLRDLFTPQGMVWAAVSPLEKLSLEGFYQYDWEPVLQTPRGFFFSGNDMYGGDGLHFAMTGAGLYSDLGTDLDSADFDTPPGSQGFDETFMQVPSAWINEPPDGGQFGFTAQIIVPRLNATTVGVHFASYHSRLPYVNGLTSSEADIQAAEALLADCPPGQDCRTYALGTQSDSARFFVTYPEDIRMLGFSIDTATLYTGTLVAVEVSHHFNWPVQVVKEGVITGAVSALSDRLGVTNIGRWGPDQIVDGIDETHKTQVALNLAQALGPRLWSAQSFLSVDFGYVHFDGLSPTSLFDANSWGYQILATATYENILGAVSLSPWVGFTHDVSGITPAPATAFLERRKSVSAGIRLNYINSVTASLGYVAFLDGEPLNEGTDRDFLSFSLRFHY